MTIHVYTDASVVNSHLASHTYRAGLAGIIVAPPQRIILLSRATVTSIDHAELYAIDVVLRYLRHERPDVKRIHLHLDSLTVERLLKGRLQSKSDNLTPVLNSIWKAPLKVVLTRHPRNSLEYLRLADQHARTALNDPRSVEV